MRQIFTLLLPVLFFSSCTPYYSGQYLTASKNSLSTIPLRPHSNEVDIFMNNEKPTKPYYKVKLIEVQAGPEVSSDVMLMRLKQQARAEGVDAIIINDIGRQANTTTTIPSGDGVIAYQKLVGLGLKYKERIDYMETILKEQVVSLWPDDNPAPKIFSMSYDFNIMNTSLGDPFIRNFFFNEIYLFEDETSIYSLLDQWEYKLDTFNNVFSKRRVINGETFQQGDFKLKGPERLKAIIKLRDAGKIYLVKYELERNYSAGNLLLKKMLRKPNKPGHLWVEEISYNSGGMPNKYIRYKIVNGKEVLYFEIQNKYYSINDLPPTDN